MNHYLRMNKKAVIITEEDISWFYLFSEADCGFRSNWTAMVNVKIFGTTPWQDNTYAYLDAIAKRRKIEHALLKLPAHQVDILYATFTNINYPAPLTKYFSKYTGSAVHCCPEPNYLYQVCTKLYNSNVSPTEKDFLESIYQIAVAEYDAAITNYYKAKRAK